MAKVVSSSAQGRASDPFRERVPHPYRRRIVILGQLFQFESNSRRMLKLVDAAYCNLPAHRLGARSKAINIRLHLARPALPGFTTPVPPDMRMHGAGGLLCGVMDSANYAVLSPAIRSGLVVATPEMLRFPHEARYLLLEFAVFTLACRGQGLIPLHAACIGLKGRALLLIGATGAGKSTLAMLCATTGMDFLTEDATFVSPASMRATGVMNYLHLRKRALGYVPDRKIATRIRNSPVIRRRSGVQKYELDLRHTGFRLAETPLKIAAIVFVTRRRNYQRLLAPLRPSQSIARLSIDQGYASAQPGWKSFVRRARKLPAYELRRGRHPLQAVEVLRGLLGSRRRARK